MADIRINMGVKGAEQVQASIDKLIQSYGKLTVKTQEYNQVAGRTMNVTRTFGQGWDASTQTMYANKLNESWSDLSAQGDILNNQFLKMGLGIAGVQIGIGTLKGIFDDFVNTAKDGVEKYRSFEMAMAEVSTTLSGKDMKFLDQFTYGVQKLSIEFGKSATDIADGLYEILSAAVDAEDALNLLYTATKASVAGLATVGETVKTFIDVMNAYGYSVEQMVHISDVLFMTVLRGTFRFSELESAIGYLAPISAEAGISFEEIGAAMATVTRHGLHLDSVTRGLALMIQDIINPTKEASDIANQYGIDLSLVSLETKGLMGFLDDVNNKLNNNREALMKLLPNMRATRVAVVLAGGGFSDFTEDCDLMSNSLGKTSEAFNKIASTQQTVANIIEQTSDAVSRAIGENTNAIAIEMQKLDRLKKQVELDVISGLFSGKYPATQREYGLSGVESISKMFVDFIVKKLSNQESKEDHLIDLGTKYIEKYKDKLKEAIKDSFADVEDFTPEEPLFKTLMKGDYSGLDEAVEGYRTYETVVDQASDAYVRWQMYQIENPTDTYGITELALEYYNLAEAVGTAYEASTRFTAAVQDAEDAMASTATKISDIDLRISELQKEIDDYNSSTSEAQKRLSEFTVALKLNSIEMMKIQLAGMMRRRGLTRSEQRQLKRLEIEATQLHIKQMQEQMTVDEEKHDAEAKHIEDLRGIIDGYKKQQTELAQTLADQVTTYAALVHQYYGIDIPADIQKTIDAYARLARTHGATVSVGVPTSNQTLQIANSLLPEPLRNILSRFGGRQRGGTIPVTAPYLLHAGERVLPAGHIVTNNITNKQYDFPSNHYNMRDMNDKQFTASGGSFEKISKTVTNNTTNSPVSVTINAVINKDMDVVELARKMRRAIDKRVANSSGLSYSRLR